MAQRKGKTGKTKASRAGSARRASPTKAIPSPSIPPVADLTNEQIERALLTGEDAGLLEDYFGTRDYAELRELAQKASSRRVRGGPKVLILPGITGSHLGQRPEGLPQNVIWLDPLEIAAGAISKLALNSGEKIVPTGAILLFYLKLKLRLLLAGYDADHYPYDWRQSLDTLGKELAERIRQDPALNGVCLVGHSMGGLVARAALTSLGAQQKNKVSKLVMLGTPNFGSFAAVLTLRGTADTVKKLAFLDLRHNANELVSEVLSTMPGLYQLLPSPERFKSIDLFDRKRWPQHGPQPDAAILRQAPAVLRGLAAADERFFLIAGVNQETFTDMRWDQTSQEFVLDASMLGDGTVPLAFAELPGAKTYYIEECHGSLPNNRTVARAVIDILGTGATTLLPDKLAAIQGRVTRSATESALAARQPYPGRRTHRLSQRELREILSEFVSAEARDTDQPQAAGAGAAAGTAADFGSRFDSLVVGRRRQHRLDLRLALGDICEVDSRAIIVGIYREVAPTGAARALDNRLDGAITELTQRRMFSGNVGEVFLLPTAQRTLRADMVAFVGLGAFDTFTEEVLRIAAENAIRTLLLGAIEDVATVLIGGGSGSSPRSALANLLAGFVKGLKDADSGHKFRSITLCEGSPDRFEVVKRELFALSSTSLFDDLEVTFDEVRLPPAVSLVSTARQAAAGPDPVYLLVRQEGRAGAELMMRTSVLGAGGKATVVSGLKSVNRRNLDLKLEELESGGFDFQRAAGFGEELASMVVSEEALSVLVAMKDRHIVVVHDADSARIPWETLASAATGEAWQFARQAGLSRRYVADNLSVAKWLEERRQDAVLNMLLVVNPTLDLDGAEEEGKRVQELLGSEPSVRIDVLHGKDATRAALEKAFRSGQYDAIHYAGHAFFDPDDVGNSGILCAGKQVLSGRDLVGLGNLPALVFFNACEAGRVRKATARGAASRPSIKQRIEENVGLAEAFLRGGVANYVGTYWPVGDAPAKLFAERFYKGLMKGETIGQALLAGRGEVWKGGSVDWADYIHYGSHTFVVKTG